MSISIFAVTLGVFLYLFLRLALPLRAAWPLKVLCGLLLLLATQHHYLLRRIGGGTASPELPSGLLLVSGWVLASVLFLFLLALGSDLYSLLRCAGRRLRGRAGAEFSPGRRVALLTCLAAAPAAYGVYHGVDIPEARFLTARLKRLPKALDGLTLVQVSDLHISPLLRESWSRAVADKINALGPQLIALTGDIVDGRPARRSEGIAPLGLLRAELGVFACAGNHEYYSGFQPWMEAFSSLGLRMLLNSHQTLRIQGESLVLAGLTDMAAERYGLPPPNRRAALQGAPEDALRILLDHRPSRARQNALSGVDLQLSGHTHGGQILGMDRIVRHYNQGYLRGWYQVEGMSLYVSSGAGLWNGFPVRLGVPSEIAVITLRSA